MGIAAAGGAAEGDRGAWRVESQSAPGHKYRVNPYAGSCSCPDYRDTGLRCKHQWAVTFVMTAETTPDGTTTTTRATRVTYAQEWSSYNRAQVEEKDTFTTLLADLCSMIPQPPQTTGRPRLPLSDMAFAACFKVYSRFSSRRFASDLREAQERGLITRAPHFNSVTNYMASPTLTPILEELITAASLPLKAVETDFAVDSSGFSTSRFVRWLDHKYERPTTSRSREWVKLHIMCGVQTNVVTSAVVGPWNENDNRRFAPLVRATAENFTLGDVSADKAYLGRKNLTLVEQMGATPFVPFKKNTRVISDLNFENSAWARMYHRFAADRDTFMAHYHKRSNVETTFSMIKSKFGDAVLSKSPTGQVNEDLCKVLAHNIVVVGHEAIELGIPVAFQ
jgi:transposase